MNLCLRTNSPTHCVSRGEWHTFPLTGLVPEYAKDRITEAFRQSFNVTKLQARYPDSSLDGFGYYDGSFSYTTLDGDANGGVVNNKWYFWPLVNNEGQGSFWKTAPMGGETRPVRALPACVAAPKLTMCINHSIGNSARNL